MKNLELLFLVAVLSLASSVNAGPRRVSNGGGAMVCPSAQGTSVELFDFWEGREITGLSFNKTDAPLLEQIQQAADLYEKAGLQQNPLFQKHIPWDSIANKARLNAIRLAKALFSPQSPSNSSLTASFLPPNMGIRAPDDLNSNFFQKGCAVEGVAIFNDLSNHLHVDKELFEKMSITDQAGLLFHEGLYRALRSAFSAEDSIASRMITACVFAQTPCERLSIDSGLAKQGFFCEGGTPPEAFSFFAFRRSPPLPNGAFWRLQFLSFRSHSLPVRAFTDIPLILSEKQNDFTKARVLLPQKRWLKSASDSESYIHLPIEILLSRENDMLTLNGKNLKCRPYSREENVF